MTKRQKGKDHKRSKAWHRFGAGRRWKKAAASMPDSPSAVYDGEPRPLRRNGSNRSR